jgi:predicted AlkP superfamily phosphohydrolase/phosphomutase
MADLLDDARLARVLVAAGLFMALPCAAHAYIGPGAGFALLNSFFVLFATIAMAALSLLLWPARLALRTVRHRRHSRPIIKRLIIVGLDGQDPKLTDRFLKEGKLPHFKQLADLGCYRPLRTTFPSVSPVAWSSFSTGTQPGRHNIFDFLDRDRRTYLPVLSSTQIVAAERFLRLGPFRIPLARPNLRLLRKSRPFWSILGDHDVWSTILRVPITFPPDRFRGAELSAMGVPDLLGSQGTFTLFSTRPTHESFEEGGIRVAIHVDGDRIRTIVNGPPNMFREGTPPLNLPLTMTIDRSNRLARIDIDGDMVELPPGLMSKWLTLRFRAAPGMVVTGICRILVIEMDEHVSVYLSPINLDPDRPAMPISHPPYYATYLAKKIGKYATLGLAEDTWALNEGVLEEGVFLQQAYDVDAERQRMFFAALDKLRAGCLVCVFDATDRIQHMFWRYLEAGHPADRGAGSEHRDAIEKVYQHNDRLIGRVMAESRDGDVVMVVSDHGFSSFRRGVNLNGWLHAEGYLALKPGTDGTAEWLRDVDWANTKAYALGLTGLFLNVKGRESSGIVDPRRATELKAEIVGKLNGLIDAATGDMAIREAFDTTTLYVGPYAANAPDLLIGYNAGYRASWKGARGVVAGAVFEDNCKAWSGDHCVDPRLVPGVFFCNRRIDKDDPALIDIAPTALDLFGISPPDYMDGKPLFQAINDDMAAPA